MQFSRKIAAVIVWCTAQVGVAQVNTLGGTNIVIDAGTSLRLDGADTWTIASGASVVNNGLITLASTASIDEAAGAPIAGLGTEHIDSTFDAPLANAEPGGLGMRLSTSAATGPLALERGHSPYTDYSGHTSVARWYRVIPAQNSGLNAMLTFEYDPVELNGLAEAGLVLHRRHSSDVWTWLDGSVDLAAHAVTSAGLDSLGTFTLFEGDLPNEIKWAATAQPPRLQPNLGEVIGLIWPSAHATTTFTLLDARGAVVCSSTLPANERYRELPTKDLAQGAYFVRLGNGITLPFIR